MNDHPSSAMDARIISRGSDDQDQDQQVPVTRAELGDLLAALGSARMRAGDAHLHDARTWSDADCPDAAAEHERAGHQLRDSGEVLLRGAGAITVAGNPADVLAELLPTIRERTSFAD